MTGGNTENRQRFVERFEKHLNNTLFIVDVDFKLLVPEIDTIIYHFIKTPDECYTCVEVGEDELKYINYPTVLDNERYQMLKKLRDEHYSKYRVSTQKRIRCRTKGKTIELAALIFSIISVALVPVINKALADLLLLLLFSLLGIAFSFAFSSILLMILKKYTVLHESLFDIPSKLVCGYYAQKSENDIYSDFDLLTTDEFFSLSPNYSKIMIMSGLEWEAHNNDFISWIRKNLSSGAQCSFLC